MAKNRFLAVVAFVGLIAVVASCTPTAKSEAHVVDVTVGAYHSCALISNGAVRCWGKGDRLGISPASIQSATPVTVQGINGTAARAIGVDAGASHTCAVLSTHAVVCWGHNAAGQLGDGTFTDHLTPETILPALFASSCTGPNFSGNCDAATQVSGGFDHTCAVKLDQGILCWGDNSYGQLGIGVFGGTYAPVPVFGLPGPALSVSAGEHETCAVVSSQGSAFSSVWCWGLNDAGQLGNNTTTNSANPVRVAFSDTGPQPVSVSVGGNATACATLSDRSVWCWGFNGNGGVGDGTTTQRDVPTRTIGATADEVAAGFAFACAADSTVTLGLNCWGSSFDGQLGTPGGDALTERTILLFGHMTAIDAGNGGHACATDQHSVWCWGSNAYGDLGDPNITGSDTPIKVPGL
jgi:alpha-tubulin suppressor-like RCC1 family protein